MLSLKEAIEVKHREAEQMLFVQRMSRGELTKLEYTQYLFQLYNIFSAIERFPLPHSDLNRSTKTLLDIYELNSVVSKDYAHPWRICQSTLDYIMHLHTLTQEQLLPHVYLNYLALMFGGQLMKQNTPGLGRLYEFDNMKDVVMSIRSIQKDEWAHEANKGLDYHIGMYNELQERS